MPTPIVASRLSPNSTGVSVEADSSVSTRPHRIRIPQESPRNADTTETSPNLSGNIPLPSIISSPIRRGNTLNVISKLNANEKLQPVRPISPVKSDSSKIPSFHIQYSERSKTTDTDTNHRPLSWTGPLPSKTDVVPLEQQGSPTKSPMASSVMHPTPYRSPYLASKKSGSYREALSAGSRRRLGNHLPRIVSGDGDDSWVAGESSVEKDAEPVSRLDKRKSLRDRDFNVDIQMQRHDLTQPGVVDGVAGLPGRLHLKAPNGLPDPTPSSRFLGGSWADKQRHLIQAYEYLCHVGEAQQWIEGCLGEELEFGVVEMEDGLRNGVVLAKLVRAFHGESAVRKIYEV
jgi:Ras GTPase-activating-like protein IQGAP2/3